MTITKDHINTLFSALRSKKLVARQDLACCQTCGMYEIDMDRAAAVKENTKHASRIGYVFYHRQDAEYAFGEPVKTKLGHVSGKELKNDLYLTFGSFEDDYIKHRDIGETVCNVVKECGLVYSWDGTPGKRIIIRNRQRK